MLEILYRIYQVATEEERAKNLQSDLDFGFYNSTSKAENNELLMDCLICDSREQFKGIIKSEYGANIRFAYSKKLNEGDLYCIIIGEHCYDTEKYFNKVEFVCDNCGNKVTTYIKKYIKLDSWDVSRLFNIEEYKSKKFCCERCKQLYLENELKRIKPNDEQEFFINRDMFTEKVAGYIYKITKKSTNEFYIGQTIYAPIFRWGQHLKTERFDIKNVLDYQFETIEIVPTNENILEREKYWIQKYYKENPQKSLNIMQTANLDQINFEDIIA